MGKLETIIFISYVAGLVFILSTAYGVKYKTGKFPIDFVVTTPPLLGIILIALYTHLKFGS